MVTFVVSLFSPNTVSFHPTSDASSVQTGTTPEREEDHVEDYLNHQPEREPKHNRSQSLTLPPTFAKLIQTPLAMARTPGATTKADDVFLPSTGVSGYPVALVDRSIVRNKSTQSLQTLGASHSHSASWGQSQDMIQPKSLAESPPSQSIFNDSTASLKGPEDKPPVFAKPSVEPPKPLLRKKKEVDYTTENYTVQATTLGNAGLFAAINAVSDIEPILDKYWVGSLGMPIDALPQDVKTHIAAKLENEYETLVVFIKDTDMNAHYENYCKEILWPMFHSQVPDVPKSKAYQDNSWSHYVTVNKAFAECVIKNYKTGDIVWVHDYHLLLVPQLVRNKHPSAQIGLYLHTAFPPSEIFRNLPPRCELILGMLGANMVAFQADSFRYQFLQTCSRLLNIEATEHGLVLDDGRFIDVFTIPMGIDIDTVDLHRNLPAVKKHMKELSEKFQGKRLIVSRDKLNRVHGLKHKLKGYKDFLERFPEWSDQAVLVQITTSVTRDHEFREEIHNLITEINSGWGDLNHQPIVYLNKDIDYSQYLALLSIADCMLVTSLSEGMNLGCHEFVICQDQSLSLKGHAPLVVSEWIGAAKVFGENAVQVNPWHPKGVAVGLDVALSMQSGERDQRWNNMFALVKKHSARAWYESYIQSLEHAWREHSTRDSASVPRLQIRALRANYDKARKRLLVVDFEGTLTTWDTPKEAVVTVPRKVIEVLSNLVDEDRNLVYIMSQHTTSALEHMFRMIPKLGLVAENGAFLRKYGQKEWTQTMEFDTAGWRDGIMNPMEAYTSANQGSTIRELKSGIMLHYFDCEDQSDAAVRAADLADQINEVCLSWGVRASPIEKGLYISPNTINKALPMQVLENEFSKRTGVNGPDFVFVIGDSWEDECVFKWAHSLQGRVKEEMIFTCVVGQRSTTASTALTQGIDAVVLTLEKLVMSGAAKAA